MFIIELYLLESAWNESTTGRPYLKILFSYFILIPMGSSYCSLDYRVKIFWLTLLYSWEALLCYNPYFTQAQTDVKHILVFGVRESYNLSGGYQRLGAIHYLLLWRCSQYVLPKHLCLRSRLHDVISQYTTVRIFPAMNTSNRSYPVSHNTVPYRISD